MYTGSPLPDNLLRVQLGLTYRQHGVEVNRNMFSGLIPETPSDSGYWPRTFFLLPPVLVRIAIAIHAMVQAPKTAIVFVICQKCRFSAVSDQTLSLGGRASIVVKG